MLSELPDWVEIEQGLLLPDSKPVASLGLETLEACPKVIDWQLEGHSLVYWPVVKDRIAVEGLSLFAHPLVLDAEVRQIECWGRLLREVPLKFEN